MQEEHEAEVKTLQARVAELDKENRDLRDNKYSLDARTSELTHKLNSSESQVSSLTEEVKRLQEQCQSVNRCLSHTHLLATEFHMTLLWLVPSLSLTCPGVGSRLGTCRGKSAADVDLAEARAQLASFREKVGMQEKVLEQQQERIQVRITSQPPCSQPHLPPHCTSMFTTSLYRHVHNIVLVVAAGSLCCGLQTREVSGGSHVVSRKSPLVSTLVSVLQDLEQSSKQLDSRCAELREAAAGHEHRSKESASQVVKSASVIERLTADLQGSKDKLKRKQVIIVRQVGSIDECLARLPRFCAV